MLYNFNGMPKQNKFDLMNVLNVGHFNSLQIHCDLALSDILNLKCTGSF